MARDGVRNCVEKFGRRGVDETGSRSHPEVVFRNKGTETPNSVTRKLLAIFLSRRKRCICFMANILIKFSQNN